MDKNVMIYIRDNSEECYELAMQMEDWNISYDVKNVSENHDHMEELQEQGIFATPVTFIDDQVILGFQKNKLKHTLGIENQSYFRTFYEEGDR